MWLICYCQFTVDCTGVWIWNEHEWNCAWNSVYYFWCTLSKKRTLFISNYDETKCMTLRISNSAKFLTFYFAVLLCHSHMLSNYRWPVRIGLGPTGSLYIAYRLYTFIHFFSINRSRDIWRVRACVIDHKGYSPAIQRQASFCWKLARSFTVLCPTVTALAAIITKWSLRCWTSY